MRRGYAPDHQPSTPAPEHRGRAHADMHTWYDPASYLWLVTMSLRRFARAMAMSLRCIRRTQPTTSIHQSSIMTFLGHLDPLESSKIHKIL